MGAEKIVGEVPPARANVCHLQHYLQGGLCNVQVEVHGQILAPGL